jgi:hypothetical protein
MKYPKLLAVLAILLFVVALSTIASPAALAQSGSGYDLSWWTVDGGGATSLEGGSHVLGGTIGQPDATVWSGGEYTLAGGFWGGIAVEYRIYLPLVLRNS